jgi:hypothetical protein
MRSLIVAVVLAVAGVSLAVAQTKIRDHSGYYELGVDYSVFQVGGDDVGLLIHSSAWSHPWKIWSWNYTTGQPGDIYYIRIDPQGGDVGYIRLNIYGLSGPTNPGARHVKEIDLLTNADNTTEIQSIYSSGDLAQLGPVWADSIGVVDIGGSLLGSLHPVHDITQYVIIGGNLAGALAADSAKDITVNGAGPHTGHIGIGTS